jgi:Barstar (barnase inhibitor)
LTQRLLSKGALSVNKELLYTSLPPCTIIDCSIDRTADHNLYLRPGINTVLRVLRGRKMRTFQALMDELGAALQFFDGFGENWYALRDCLRSLDEWLPAEAYILVVTHPQDVLKEEPDELSWFLKVMDEVHDWWSRPIVDNGPYNRSAVPFRVILQATENEWEEVCHRYPSIPVLSR